MDKISIHALREEGDRQPEGWIYSDKDFYPRPPRGGRRRNRWRTTQPTYFYPRPPRGGRRSRIELFADQDAISIHALREEGDPHLHLFLTPKGGFLSTPSARRATRTG